MEDLKAEIERLRLENQKLKQEVKEKALTLKVSEKTGSVCLFGINKLPVSLYRNGWMKVLENADRIRQFIEDNKEKIDELEAKNKATK